MTYKRLFTELRLNQSFYADQLGISKGYLCDMLNGHRPFKKDAELRTHLRNHATTINNFLEKEVDNCSQL